MSIKKIEQLFGNWMKQKTNLTPKPGLKAGMEWSDWDPTWRGQEHLTVIGWMAPSVPQEAVSITANPLTDVNSWDKSIYQGRAFCLVYSPHFQSFTAKWHLPGECPHNKLLAEFYWSSPKWQRRKKNLNKSHLDLYGNLKNAFRLSLLTTVFMIAIVFAGQSILYSITNCQVLTRFPPLLGPMY